MHRDTAWQRVVGDVRCEGEWEAGLSHAGASRLSLDMLHFVGFDHRVVEGQAIGQLA